MKIARRGEGKPNAIRQQEHRERMKQRQQEDYLFRLYAHEFHRAIEGAEATGIPMPGKGLGADPVETLRNFAEYYLAEAQAARMEEFARRAGNRKSAIPRSRAMAD